MSRQSYPSDHRRWFRVAEDILDDPKLAECPDSACWLFIQILALLNRSKSRDGVLTVPARYLNSATNRNRHGTDMLLSRLQVGGILEYERQGKSTIIRVHKWAKHQGFSPARLQPDSARTPAPKTTPKTTPTTTPSVSAFDTHRRLLNLLKGEPPEGFESKQSWFEDHADLIVAEAERTTGQLAGVEFNGAVKATCLRFWRWQQRNPNGKLPAGVNRQTQLEAAAKKLQDEADDRP